MKTDRFLLLLLLVFLGGGGCAVAPLAAHIAASTAAGYNYGSVMAGLGDSKENTQDAAVIVYRDGEYAKGVVKKAFKNLGIPVADNGNGVVRGVTKDGINVEVRVTEKTSKMTQIDISTRKGLVSTDPLVSRLIADEIKKIAGIS